MNSYQINLMVSDEDGHIFFNEVIQTKSLVELMSKLLITSARLQVILEERKLDEDGIPF